MLVKVNENGKIYAFNTDEGVELPDWMMGKNWDKYIWNNSEFIEDVNYVEPPKVESPDII
jgi:hypothetical protein